ncbi:LabA-like NYN domain-containing protein [Limnofasciculus baicalensis]|uniref:NYN domain-containing protein n=1 Tax=Limnofasciculus baicalensis BBK-W-15 TaxID=2699891 RepID=A0AAE3GSM5_9CYAN|nr:NYN domain-containing protein [Limnofasciculus baicalensis]MCP2729113.1 NYN domain-containing protein [Limnofasciculus baicalensis BBK-W-15]
MLNNFSSDPIFTPEQVLENRGRVAIFIDGSNLFYAALQLGIEIDYTKLLVRLTAGSRLLRSFFYTGVDRTNEKQQGFLLWMRRNGYRVIAKDLVQLPDGSKKANLDVEIAVDMMALVGSYDTAVLVSGDGDLAYAVDAVSYRGVRVEVVSLRSMTSDSLINVADRYIDLETIQETIQKTHRPHIGANNNNGYIYRPLSSPLSIGMMDEHGDPSIGH